MPFWIIIVLVLPYPIIAYFFYGLGGCDEARRQVRLMELRRK